MGVIDCVCASPKPLEYNRKGFEVTIFKPNHNIVMYTPTMVTTNTSLFNRPTQATVTGFPTQVCTVPAIRLIPAVFGVPTRATVTGFPTQVCTVPARRLIPAVFGIETNIINSSLPIVEGVLIDKQQIKSIYNSVSREVEYVV